MNIPDRFNAAAFARAHRQAGLRGVQRLAFEFDVWARMQRPPRRWVHPEIQESINRWPRVWFPGDSGLSWDEGLQRVSRGGWGFVGRVADAVRSAFERRR